MTRSVTYTLLDPTGNRTLLAETPVPEADQPEAARQLMAREPETEQVGFLSRSPGLVRLRMAGGEFCGNASLCAAALALLRTGRQAGTLPVAVSGTAEPVEVRLTSLPDGGWRGTVTMPLPLSIRQKPFPDGVTRPVVRFPGIAHVILEEAPDRETAQALAPAWCAGLGAEALGLMFLDEAKGALTPLVYVPAAGTLFWESSCASGTTAVGAYLAHRSGGPVAVPLTQPGGTLTIAARPGGPLLLTGTVTVRHSGRAEIAL